MKSPPPSSPIAPMSSSTLGPKKPAQEVPQKMTVIAAYPQSITAELVKSRLQSEGLEVRLVNNDIASNLFSMAAGGIKVQVPEADAQRAFDILESLDDQALGELPEEFDPEEEALQIAQQKHEISLAQSAWRSSVLTPIFPPLLLWNLWLVARSYALESKAQAGWKRPAALALNAAYFAFLAYALTLFL